MNQYTYKDCLEKQRAFFEREGHSAPEWQIEALARLAVTVSNTGLDNGTFVRCEMQFNANQASYACYGGGFFGIIK